MKNFIQDLEKKLIVSNMSFNDFTDQLWFYLCRRTKPELRRLTKELGAKGKYMNDSNIGNIKMEIIEKLGLKFMII